jgi:type II secretory pathway component PulF
MIVTPRELALRAELYHQAGSMLKAGLGLPSIIEQLAKKPPKASFREPLNLVLYHLNHGMTFAEALTKTNQWIPEFDIYLLEAGEKSGRLPESFQMLSDYYRERAELIMSLIQKVAYPVFLFHLAALIFPVSSLQSLTGNGTIAGFFFGKLLILGPVYALVFLAVLAGQGRHGESWRATLEMILHAIPVLGTARRNLALARLSASLQALLMAGVATIEAWMLSAAACGSPSLRRSVLSWKVKMERGDTPSELINGDNAFPELFANLYHSGEMSGKLDESLGRIYQYYQEEGSRKMRNFLSMLGVAITLGIMIGIAANIILFYMGYFKQIQDVSG